MLASKYAQWLLRIIACSLLVRRDRQRGVAAFSTRGNKKEIGRPKVPRPIIPTDSFAHLSAIQDGIEILPASGGKGLGAFACRGIAKGTTIGEYTGEILTRLEVEARYWGLRKGNKHDRKWRNSRRRRNQGISGDYLFDMGSDVFIDAEDADVSSWCRFANHAKPNDGTTACNVEARARTVKTKLSGKRVRGGVNEEEETRHLFFVALYDIEAGTEICYDYSTEYWDE
uniref:SET domain-containing protein n=1 Tax=Odontella aurita TaxID=265563 RepID=A0A7S4IEB2_9STRA|mmetsp:Transcript_23806/g.70337  ORF Transcript_23806/g.70337 Transcript_23806/m.70337 type:complete len:228 (+) Transcript_23806:156-839(+)